MICSPTLYSRWLNAAASPNIFQSGPLIFSIKDCWVEGHKVTNDQELDEICTVYGKKSGFKASNYVQIKLLSEEISKYGITRISH